MWAEIIVVLLLIAVCYLAYGAMQPEQTCSFSVKKPASENSSNKTAMPDIKLECKRSG